jgi:acid phosphatase family membrane protein YuiD
MEILQNTCLISAVLAWAVAQLCKLLIELIAHHRLDWERLTGDGGMPSGHSATAALLQYGAASFQFAISAVLAIIVMHDAMGVRWQAGQHARTINELLLKLSDTPPEQLLEEFLGHTPLQVACGALLGAAVAILYSLP